MIYSGIRKKNHLTEDLTILVPHDKQVVSCINKLAPGSTVCNSSVSPQSRLGKIKLTHVRYSIKYEVIIIVILVSILQHYY